MDVISEIKKFSGLKAFIGSDPSLEVKTIPFRIPQLDSCIGGGIPQGRLCELVGEFSVGKTLLCQKLIQSAQMMGLECLYYNVENKYSPAWFRRVGVDTDKLFVIQGNIGESVFDSVIAAVQANIGLLVIDSIAALMSIAEQEDEMAQSTIGLQPRMVSKGLRKIMAPLSTSRTAVVFTNQLRSGIGKYVTDVYPGGRAQYFYSSMTIHVRRGDWIVEKIKDVEERKGFRIMCRTVKNTIAPPWRECAIPFLFSGEIDFVAIMCEMALDSGIIQKSGSWYILHNEQKVQGWDNVLDFYKKDQEMLKALSQKMAGEE